MQITKSKINYFKQAILSIMNKNVQKIDSEGLFKIVLSKAAKFKETMTLLEFYHILERSKCFVVDDGTHGTVWIPKPLREWDDHLLSICK